MVELRPIQLLVDHAVSPRGFFVYLVASFAGLGLMLALLGIYGVSYSVTQRTQEIGIRIALGATQGTVQMGVIRQTLQMAVVVGIVLGGIASLAVWDLIASLLFGTAPTDPSTFALIVVLVACVALAAGYIPARRASRIDPMVALRES